MFSKHGSLTLKLVSAVAKYCALATKPATAGDRTLLPTAERLMMWEKSKQRCKAEFSSAKYHHHPFTAGYQRTWQAVTLPACYLSSSSGLPFDTFSASLIHRVAGTEDRSAETEGRVWKTVWGQREFALLLFSCAQFPGSNTSHQGVTVTSYFLSKYGFP